jgi:hypothetical protein
MNIIANTIKRKLAQKTIKTRKRGTNMKQPQKIELVEQCTL